MDPYRPPQSRMALAQKSGYGVSEDPFHGQRWEIGDTLNLTWERFKDNLGLMFAIGAISFAVNIGFSFVGQIIVGVSDPDSAVFLVLFMMVQVASMVAQTLIVLGTVNVGIKIARQDPVSFGDMILPPQLYVAGIGMTVLTTLGMMLGYLMLIVPGIIWTLAVSLAMFSLVDKQEGAIAAIKDSLSLTEGQRMKLFLWMMLASALMMLVTLFTCGFGLLVATPFMFTAFALIYDNSRRHQLTG